MKTEVTITKKAADKIIEFAKQDNKSGYGLKLVVFPGGCAGLQYGMDFEKSPSKTDMVIESNGVKLYLDKSSLNLISGASIDYEEGLTESGFKINNPNASNHCHCGKSDC